MLSVFFLFTRHLGLDLVPRKDFEVVDSDQISVSDLYKMVRNLTQGKLVPARLIFSPLLSLVTLRNNIAEVVPLSLPQCM